MEWIRNYFCDLFMSDATAGLYPEYDDGQIAAFIDDDGSFVLPVTDDDGEEYEIRVTRL